MHTSERRVVLVGAGFSCNWGNPTAHGMIENLVRALPWSAPSRLRELALEPDFEMLPEIVRSEGMGSDAERYLATAFEVVFHQMHKNALEVVSLGSRDNSDHTNCIRALADYIRNWSTDRTHTFVSLNQDLMLETLLELMQVRVDIHLDSIQQTFLEDLSAITHQPTMAQATSPTVRVIKPHGSCHWLSDAGPPRMVIGKQKPGLISSDLFLREQWNATKTALQGECQITCIGYSFRDEHINELIAASLAHDGSSLILVDPNWFQISHAIIQKEPFPGFKKIRKVYGRLGRDLFHDICNRRVELT